MYRLQISFGNNSRQNKETDLKNGLKAKNYRQQSSRIFTPQKIIDT